jgi:hypothetical protein
LPEESRTAIEALARRVQGLPGEIRWVYTEQAVIVATANDKPVTPGIWTARISRPLKLLAKLGLEVVAAKLASLTLLVTIYHRQSFASVISGKQRLFIGISALRENTLVSQFEAMCSGRVAVIDQRFSGALASIYRPSARELFRAWHDAARPVFGILASAKSTGLLDRLAVLTYVVRRLHHYAHFLAVFRGLNSLDPRATVAFSTADLPAYAAVRAGIETMYFPHGFLARSVVFPDFHSVIAFNAPDAEHIRSRLPAATVTLPPPAIRPLQVTRRVAVVGDHGDKLARSRDLIEFCRAADIDVVVRPHPADRSGYWTMWRGVSGVLIDPDGTFDEFLERHCPYVMATWHSTVVYEALLRGVVPVSFAGDVPDLVFPLGDVTLNWPEQKEQIQAVLSDPNAKHEALAKSLAYVIGPTYLHSAIHKIEAYQQPFTKLPLFLA